MADRKPAGRDNQAAIGLARDRRNGAFNFDWLAHADWFQLYSEQRPHGLHCRELTDAIGRGGVSKDYRSRDAGPYLFEYFQQFRADSIFVLGKTGGVAARPRQTIDKAGTNRIRNLHKYDRQHASSLLQGR